MEDMVTLMVVIHMDMKAKSTGIVIVTTTVTMIIHTSTPRRVMNKTMGIVTTTAMAILIQMERFGLYHFNYLLTNIM
jgi:hypothetical protein